MIKNNTGAGDIFFDTEYDGTLNYPDPRTFTVTMVNGRKSFIEGNDIKDIFGIIDGLRLQGKRWLKTFDFEGELIHEVYINIDHIVSIE